MTNQTHTTVMPGKSKKAISNAADAAADASAAEEVVAVAAPRVVLTASQLKAQKAERLRARYAKYVLEPKYYRERVIEPLVKTLNKLISLALVVGASPEAAEGEKSDKAADAIRKRLGQFKDKYVKRLNGLGAYYSTVYRVGGKRAENVAHGKPPVAPREAVMFRSVSQFQPALYSFIREAAETNEALRPAGDCATFDTDSPLNGYMSSTYAAQTVLAYVAANRLFNKENGQYITPDDLMRKHLGAGIAKVLASIAKSADDQKDPKLQKVERERMTKFPSQFTFCRLQELIGFYRQKPDVGSAALVKRDAVRKNQDLWPVLRTEFETMSKIRENAYNRIHAEKPQKAAVTKGPRGPLTDEQKHARRIKRAATALANGLGFELDFVPKVPKAIPALPPTEASRTEPSASS